MANHFPFEWIYKTRKAPQLSLTELVEEIFNDVMAPLSEKSIRETLSQVYSRECSSTNLRDVLLVLSNNGIIYICGQNGEAKYSLKTS